MSIDDKIKDDTEKNYLHPEGKPTVAPKTSEEKQNLAKANASTELVAEISKESGNGCSKNGGVAKGNGVAAEKDEDDTLQLEKI